MSVYNRLAKNTAIFAIGNFLSKFITLLMLPFYTTFLSQADYGQIDIIVTTLILVVPILTVNIVEAVIRFSLDRENYNYGEVVTNAIAFILIGIIILLGIYPLLNKIDFLEEYLLIFYGLFIMQALHTSIKQFARSIDLMKVYMISDLIYTISFVLFNIIFIYFLSMNVFGYLMSMLLAFGCDILFLTSKTNVQKYIRYKYLDKGKMKVMLFYCIPLIPNTIMWWVMSISDRYLITYYVGLSANGIYAVASKIPAILTNLYTIFYKAWQISAIEEYNNSNKDEYYSNIFNLYFFLISIFASFYMIFNKFIVSLIVAENFFVVWKYAPILVLGAVFSSFSSFIGTNYVAMKQTKGALYTSIFGAIVNIILNIILIPKYGLFGAAIATLISFLVVCFIRAIDTRRFVKIEYHIVKMILVYILIGIQIITGYLENNISLYVFINISCLLVIIYMSFDYTKKPFFFIAKKLGAFIKK